MENFEKRPPRRIPLSDCTNTVAASAAAAVASGVQNPKSAVKSVAEPVKPHRTNTVASSADAAVAIGYRNPKSAVKSGAEPVKPHRTNIAAASADAVVASGVRVPKSAVKSVAEPVKPHRTNTVGASADAAIASGVRNPKSAVKSVAEPVKPHRLSKRKPEENSSCRFDTRFNDTGNAAKPSSLDDAVSPPPAKDSTPLRPSKASSYLNPGTVDCEIIEFHTVYNRRKTAVKVKGKEKAVAEPMSCPPLIRTRETWNELNDGDTHLSKSHTSPRKKKQCAPEIDLPTQEFIEQQKAYFAEVDAFELPEEFVSDQELE